MHVFDRERLILSPTVGDFDFLFRRVVTDHRASPPSPKGPRANHSLAGKERSGARVRGRDRMLSALKKAHSRFAVIATQRFRHVVLAIGGLGENELTGLCRLAGGAKALFERLFDGFSRQPRLFRRSKNGFRVAGFNIPAMDFLGSSEDLSKLVGA